MQGTCYPPPRPVYQWRDATPVPAATPVPGRLYVAITAGYWFACGLMADGTFECFGKLLLGAEGCLGS